MTYVIIISVAFIAIVIYRFVIRPSMMRKRMVGGVAMVQMALGISAFNKLLPHYGRDMAAKFGAAISNEVFSDIPTTDQAKKFLIENRRIVRDYAQSILCDDTELCFLLPTAIWIKCFLDALQKKRDAESMFDPMDNFKEIVDPLDNFKELGQYIDDVADKGFKHYSLFYYCAASYLGRVKSNSSTDETK